MSGPQGVPRKPSGSPLPLQPLRSLGKRGGWQGDLWSSSKPPPSTDWTTSLTSLPLTVGSGARSHL